MIKYTISVNKHNIRLTDERWQHISNNHPEMNDYKMSILQTISEPDAIYYCKYNELIAMKSADNKYIIVIYKEIIPNNGFIITSFLTNKLNYFKNKKISWKKQ